MNPEQRDILEAAFGSLPTKEGYELVGVENIVPRIRDTFFGSCWAIARVHFDSKFPTAIFKKIKPTPKPTTLHDLMPNGNENVYLHSKEESWGINSTRHQNGDLYVGGHSIKGLSEVGYRWSHSIHTSYEEANEVVV